MTSVPPSATLVTGMHRSGTSALTRCISLLGLDLGTGPHLGASETNVHGHWESRSMVDIDDDLLAALGGAWACPPATHREAVDRAAAGELGDRARTMFRQEFGRAPFVVKDPRAALVLDFWLHLVPPGTTVVLVLRHPAAVAGSLSDRDGFSISHGLALWERYCRSAISALVGQRVVVVRYESVIADPAHELQKLQGWLTGHTDEGRVAAAAASLDPAAVHHDAVDCTALTGSQQVLWRELRQLVGLHEPLHEPVRTSETPGLQAIFDVHRRVNALQGRSAELEASLQEMRAREDRLRSRETELLAQLDAERQHRCALDEELARMTRVATRLDALLADRQRALDTLTLARIRRPLRDRLRVLLRR